MKNSKLLKNHFNVRLTCLILALLLILPLASCNNENTEVKESSDAESSEEVTVEVTTENQETEKDPDTEEKPKPEPSKDLPVMHKLNSKTPGLKVLGVRNLEDDEKVHADWSCSGIELNINLKKGNIRFALSSSNPCYYRVYIDGAPFMNGESPYFEISGNSSIFIRGLKAGDHTVTLMKVTGYTLARSEINSVTFIGEIRKDSPKDNDRYIEFIGDSITCGWGTIGNHSWLHSDQDGTFAYPYLLAKKLNADYAMTALSGQGLFCGNPGFPKGYMYASALKNDSEEYNFARKANLVVINIGENDERKASESAFKEAYISLLQTVKAKNGPMCKILCVHNVMGDPFGKVIKEACAELGGEAAGIYYMKLDRTTSTVAGGHPTIAEHAAYAEVLEPVLAELLKPFKTDIKPESRGDGDKDFIDFSKI